MDYMRIYQELAHRNLPRGIASSAIVFGGVEAQLRIRLYFYLVGVE